MPQSGFEPSIPETQQPQIYILDGAATGIGWGDPQNLNSLLKYISDINNNNNKLSVDITTILVLSD